MYFNVCSKMKRDSRLVNIRKLLGCTRPFELYASWHMIPFDLFTFGHVNIKKMIMKYRIFQEAGHVAYQNKADFIASKKLE